MLEINNLDKVIIDGTETAFSVIQGQVGTIVTKNGEPVEMPHQRYNLVTDNYLKLGIAGRTQFESDIKKLI